MVGPGDFVTICQAGRRRSMLQIHTGVIVQPLKSSPVEMIPESGPKLYVAVMTWKLLELVGRQVKMMPDEEGI